MKIEQLSVTRISISPTDSLEIRRDPINDRIFVGSAFVNCPQDLYTLATAIQDVAQCMIDHMPDVIEPSAKAIAGCGSLGLASPNQFGHSPAAH